MSSVEVSDLTVETIGRQLGQLSELNQIGPVTERVTLDFKLQSPPDPMASAVFAQAMLGIRKDVYFVVHLPREQATISSLIRSGVASALARRRECISFEPATRPIAAENLWLTWTPAAGEAMAPMFAATDPGKGLFGPGHAVFVNPHLTTEPEGPASITRLVERWLTQVVTPGLTEAQHRRAIAGPVFTVDQLVRNVSEHAITSSHPTVDSMVGLEVVTTSGRRYLRVTVLDTGAGVVSTLRPKLVDEHQYPTDDELLGELLSGELPGWGRGRGFGLSAVAALALNEPHSSLELWTAGTRMQLNDSIEASPTGAEIVGTVLSVLFPLPAI